MQRLLSAIGFSVLALLALPVKSSPLDGPYSEFIKYCASTPEAGKLCGIYYQLAFDAFKEQEARGDFSCAQNFSSVRYIKVHEELIAAGRGAVLKPKDFLTAAYKETRVCTALPSVSQLPEFPSSPKSK